MPHQKSVALPILPGATLGVMGGGQLGRMFIHAAQSMGYTTAVLDPDANSPAGLVSHHHVQTDYLDADGLKELAQLCQAVTTEFENVPAQSLMALSKSCPVAPSAAAVAVAQDRRVEKARLAEIGKASGVVPVPYALIEKDMHVSLVDTIYLPGILKSATQGYDGKGQIKVTTKAQLAIAWAQLGKVPCVLELMVPLHEEFSVVLARGEDGRIVHFAPQRNVHINGILAATYAHESDLKPSDVKELVDAAKAIANSIKYVGVLCVEFFLLIDGSLVVNEIAPRPHNSGHYTLDACDVSQFELQVRALCRLPLPQPHQHSPAIMLNLLGDLWFKTNPNAAQTPPWEKVLALPGTHLHLYGKSEAKPGRKMGHLTITGSSLEAVQSTTQQAAKILGIDKY
ncbi:MAG: 5-(carboxyamino)imidazole ribonucleotide synthase [Burkholderiaceae bacterium]